MRISQKCLQICADNINAFTSHKVSILFTQGCGVYLNVDGMEYNHMMKNSNATGISNKEAYEIINKYDNEAIQNCIKSKKI